MTPGARLSAAIEVLADIEARRRPAADALKDWGLSHRFAGSGDRAAIAGLVYDALRRRASSAFVMGDETPRAVAARHAAARAQARCRRDRAARRRRALCAAAAERRRSARGSMPRASTARRRDVAGDYPEWLDPHLARIFGDERAEEGAALATPRAARSARQHAQGRARRGCRRARRSRCRSRRAGRRSGLRIALARRRQEPGDPRRAGLHQGHDRGAGRRLAARRAARGRQARRAGGRSLRRRRRQDAGARGGDGESRARSTPPTTTSAGSRRSTTGSSAPARATCRSARRNRVGNELADLAGRIDLVLIDAPCTGTGAWRRNPDAKWRVRPGALRAAHEGAGRGARPRRRRW